jgi:predicted metal-dependent HD superfamily phosphohydrolase
MLPHAPEPRWPADREAWETLVARYAEPHRHYHTLAHARAVVAALPTDAPVALVLAAWYHDVVYDPKATDNEMQSALFLQQQFPHSPHLDEATRLILLTHTHSTTPDDSLGHALLDADLAILAADPAEYDAYAVGIRQEYAWVPEAEYRAGRRAVLQRFLDRERLFFTPVLQARQHLARANLLREITALRDT